jgi:hypothetical protein
LYGLTQSLQAQGKEEQAAGIKERFRKAWNQADVSLTASRFMGAARTQVATTLAPASGVQR